MLTEFSSIIELINKFPTEQHCIAHLEAIRWGGNVVSPFNPDSKVYACKGNKYKCKESGKYFNVRTTTIFEDTKLPLQKWFMALYLFSSHKKGISSHQLAKDLNITQKSAWFVLHRLRYAFDHPAFKAQMSNTVEVDETYIGGKEINKHASKKKYKDGQKRLNDKAPVVGMIDRKEGRVMVQQIETPEHSVIEFVVTKNVSQEATLVSDQSRAYDKMNKFYHHLRVDHSAKEYVNGVAHTNTIEGFWSQFKRGIVGIYHWVSVKHLGSYAHEFAYRYNTRKISENNRFNLVLANMVGRLKYNELIA